VSHVSSRVLLAAVRSTDVYYCLVVVVVVVVVVVRPTTICIVLGVCIKAAAAAAARAAAAAGAFIVAARPGWAARPPARPLARSPGQGPLSPLAASPRASATLGPSPHGRLAPHTTASVLRSNWRPVDVCSPLTQQQQQQQ